MPVLDPLVRFQLSGGDTNENPHLSLGGQISTATNRNIVSNFLHGFFDEVTNTEAVSGEYEYRHFYFRNSHDFTLRNPKLLVLSDQTSKWSKIEFAKGPSDNGLVEQAIPDENTAPVGIPDTDWVIPNIANPLALGDVLGGSTASIWCRRKIEPGALIAKGETITIRIIGDPPVPTVPPVTCPSGQHYDTTTQQCEDNEEPPDPDCPEGQHKDENGNCVENSGTPCPEGEHLEGTQCVPDGSPTIPDPVIMTFAGDIGCGSAGGLTTLLAGSIEDMNLFVANGDLSYTSSIDCFMSDLDQEELTDRTTISIGNHDDEEDGSSRLRSDFLSAFGLPSVGYYSFDMQNIHVLVMDTQSTYSINSPQYIFARNDLISASTNASIDWIVVCYHKPSMTISSNHSALTDFRNIYHPMFDTYHVDFVISGHNHNMQCTFPLRHNASSPTSPTIVTQGETRPDLNRLYTNPDGRIFIVSGAGGDGHYSLGSTPSHYDFADDEHFGLFLLGWFNNNKSVTGIFYRTAQNTGDAEELYSFTVHK